MFLPLLNFYEPIVKNCGDETRRKRRRKQKGGNILFEIAPNDRNGHIIIANELETGHMERKISSLVQVVEEEVKPPSIVSLSLSFRL